MGEVTYREKIEAGLEERVPVNMGELQDVRSAIRRLWERATYNPVIGDGHFLASGTVVFSLLDRVLILMGRDVRMVVTTKDAPDLADETTYQLIDTLTLECGTAPRRYRTRYPNG